jgi:uncharacterized protein (TIGR00251 family)
MSFKVSIRVKPGAKRTFVGGQHDQALIVSVQAPAVDGRANDAVIDAIAEALKIKKRDIIILHGHTGRDKLIEIIDDTKKPQIDALLNIQ